MEHKLQVRNLTVSFRTNEGKVQAVRNIDFDLEQGETLAIVGESGSGKSVTSKAILGILAGNAIIEGGEIIYDGKDLLKISEEEFHKIRGDKIAMIFQDPMSSLNPIARIGKQLTEAMLLKGKARQRQSRTAFNTYLHRLNREMLSVLPDGNATEKCRAFDGFEYRHLALESAYNRAFEAASEAVSDIDALAFELEKKAAKDTAYRLRKIRMLSLQSIQEYVVKARADELRKLTDRIGPAARKAKSGSGAEELIGVLRQIREILDEAGHYDQPNFFALGYYVKFSGQPVPEMPVNQLNKFMRAYLDEHFMLDFLSDVSRTLEASAKRTDKKIEEAVDVLQKHREVFCRDQLDRKECEAAFREMEHAVRQTIDPLAISKDSLLYTFPVGFRAELNRYFGGIVNNKKEQARFARQSAKHAAMRAKNKEPNWTVVAPSLVDFEQVKSTLLEQIDRLVVHYKENRLALMVGRDFNAEAVAVVDYLKACASGVVQKVTRRMAKAKAIKLMEEVGISEPRKRYRQYPFEFSGGMRQRIVIAIALAANPDILICDEPTTALDVTIQSQILELINRLKQERHLSVIFITHDLGVVANMADRIAVMYAGKIVEYGTSEDVFYHAAHPYTWALLSSMPDLDTNEKLDAIPGTPPNMIYPPVGDAFAERNKYALKIDFEMQPPMFQISDTHYAATWLLHPDAPKVDPPKVITDRIARMKEKREAQRHGN